MEMCMSDINAMAMKTKWNLQVSWEVLNEKLEEIKENLATHICVKNAASQALFSS